MPRLFALHVMHADEHLVYGTDALRRGDPEEAVVALRCVRASLEHASRRPGLREQERQLLAQLCAKATAGEQLLRR